MNNNVSHPAHYTKQPVECKEITKHLNHYMSSAVKYIWRYEDKENPLEDLYKAKQYIAFQLDEMPDFLELGSGKEEELLGLIDKCDFSEYQRKAIANIVMAHSFSTKTARNRIDDALVYIDFVIDCLIAEEIKSTKDA